MNYIYKCPKCESLNISLDIETGKTNCLDCNYSDDIKRLDEEEFRMKYVEKEEAEIMRQQSLGTEVNINLKKDRISNEDYSLLNPD